MPVSNGFRNISRSDRLRKSPYVIGVIPVRTWLLSVKQKFPLVKHKWGGYK